MPRLAAVDERRARALESQLRTVVEGGPSALAEVTAPLKELLGTEIAHAYTLEQRGERVGVESMFSVGSKVPHARVSRLFDQFVVGNDPVSWSLYGGHRPERSQRNVVVTHADLRRRGWLGPESSPLTRDFFPRVGLADRDQMRVLVCEGPSLLAWVGAFQPDPFEKRQRGILRRLVPALHRRLSLERALGSHALRGTALAAALEAIGRPAFVLGRLGEVRQANAAGRALFDAQPGGVGLSLKDTVRRRPSELAFELTPLTIRGAPEGYLALLRTADQDSLYASRIASAATRWGLTARQREVLALVARGLANRTIAATLGVSERAVELHVSAIFDRAGVGNRSALVSTLLSRW